jgi:hypothetical protein
MLDPAPYRQLFPISEHYAYFSHPGISPVNTRAVAAILQRKTAHTPIGEFVEEIFAQLLDLRQRFATLILPARWLRLC